MIKFLLVVSMAGSVAVASARPADEADGEKSPVHIIDVPTRCPEGTKPDAGGRCRPMWDRKAEGVCPDGEEVDREGICRRSSLCPEGDCDRAKGIRKRDAEREERTTEVPTRKKGRTGGERKAEQRRGRNEEGAARSKHFLIMLKKKKAQMMKPKPPPPPPHHHHPHHPESDEEPEEEPAEEEEPAAPERLLFGDELCPPASDGALDCRRDAEMVADAPNELEEWAPRESSGSSESSSSSDSDGESGSGRGSGESDDELLEKAIKIKLMKIFRMKQRYGPALRRWLVDRLREYEDSFN